MKFCFALVFAIGCAANSQLEKAHFAAHHVALLAQKTFNAEHRMLVTDPTTEAIDKCLNQSSLPPACKELGAGVVGTNDPSKITADVINKMCDGTPSCSSQISGMYTEIGNCATTALGGDTTANTTEFIKKAGDMAGKLMCIKDEKGNYCLPKLANMGDEMMKSMGIDPSTAGSGTMPPNLDIQKMMQQMCTSLACLGSCWNAMSTMMSDLMGGMGGGGGMPGMDLNSMMKQMCGDTKCPGASAAGTATPLVFVTALLAVATQLF